MSTSISGTGGITFNDASVQNYKESFEYKDGKLFWKKTQRLDLIGKEISGVNGDGYVCVKLNGKTNKVHRIIFAMFNGYEPSVIDHINGDKTDNRIENLREVTRSQNAMNRTPKNVCWNKNRKKWIVRLMKDGNTVHYSFHEEQELAAFVAAEARIKYFGEYARAA